MSNHRSDHTTSMVRRRRSTQAAVAVFFTAALLAGCGGSDDSSDAQVSTAGKGSDSTSTTASTESGSGGADTSSDGGSSGSSTSTSTPGADLAGASTDRKEADPSNPAMEPAELTRVRVGAHEGYERVVFEFQGELPGYDVGYLESDPVEDGSGDPIDIKGTEFLSVRIFPASGVRLSDDSYETIYTGPKRLSGAGAPVLEVVRSGDFEAQVTWDIGLDSQRPFVVSTLSSPPRIVVDVAD